MAVWNMFEEFDWMIDKSNSLSVIKVQKVWCRRGALPHVDVIF